MYTCTGYMVLEDKQDQVIPDSVILYAGQEKILTIEIKYKIQ